MEFWINVSCVIFFIASIAIITTLKSKGESLFDFLFAIWVFLIGFLISLDFMEGECSLILNIIFWITVILIACLTLIAAVFLILSFIYEKKKNKKREDKSIKYFYISLIIAGVLNIILQILRIFIK